MALDFNENHCITIITCYVVQSGVPQGSMYRCLHSIYVSYGEFCKMYGMVSLEREYSKPKIGETGNLTKAGLSVYYRKPSGQTDYHSFLECAYTTRQR